MLSKRMIIVLAVLCVLVCGTLAYFYLDGESLKQSFVYSYENPAEGQEYNAQDISAVVPIALLTQYMSKTFDLQERQAASDTCVADYFQCIEKYSPTEKIKEQCKKAVQAIKDFTLKIKNENSIVLGINKTIAMSQAPYCQDLLCNTENAPDFYGSKQALKSLNSCIEELNKASKEDEKALAEKLSSSEKIDSCLRAFLSYFAADSTGKSKHSATVIIEFEEQLSETESEALEKLGIHLDYYDTGLPETTQYSSSVTLFELDYLANRADVVKITASDPRLQELVGSACNQP